MAHSHSAISADSLDLTDRTTEARAQVAMAADPPLSEAQLHGLACVDCGARSGDMVPDPDGEIDRVLDPEELFGRPTLVRCAGAHASDLYRKDHPAGADLRPSRPDGAAGHLAGEPRWQPLRVWVDDE